MQGAGMTRPGDWVVLRCAGAATLRLASSLAQAGFEVWTPSEVREQLAGRKRELVEVEAPILPDYVFAKFDHLAELLRLSHSPSLNYQVWDSSEQRMVTKGHPYFTLFRDNGEIRPVRDKNLQPLRAIEEALRDDTERRREAAKRKGPAPQFTAGDVVRVEGSGFEGLDLTVAETNEGKTVKLHHPDWMWTVEISAWKLQSIHIESALPEQETAKAA
jgi:transcription antitermination factor NusG